MIKVSEPIYEVTGLEHGYAKEPVLRVDSLSIPANAIVGLTGPNGSGKSTLLNLLGFVFSPMRGAIRYKGRLAAPFSQRVRFQITLLNQEPYLLRRSVAKNIAYGLELRGLRHDLKSRVDEALSWVGLPPRAFARRPWSELSGGEARRVALAARLVLRPEVLLLDEPTASIDADSAERIKSAALRARREWGTTVLIASHDQHWLNEVCDDVLNLFKGRLFGGGQLNVVFGPWQPLSDRSWHKALSDGQLLVVPPPPAVDAVAVFTPASILQEPPSVSEEGKVNVLHGVISRLMLEKSDRRIVATVQAGGLSFAVHLTPSQVADMRLCPGQDVDISLCTDAVEWV